MSNPSNANEVSPEPARRRVLSYANVTSTLALVLALGAGSAWAAKHYVISSTSQIKPSVIKKLHGTNGTNGTNGSNGTNGATGATGVAGLAHYQVVVSANINNPNGAQTGGIAQCPAGDVVLGGGAVGGSGSVGQNINSSSPSPGDQTNNQAWGVNMNNNSGSDTYFNVYAVCAVVAP